MNRRGERLLHLGWGITLLSLPFIAWAAAPLIQQSNPGLCLFRAVTGRPCIFCGLTRAFAFATRGNLQEAFVLHPFWWVAVMLCFGIGAALVMESALETPPYPPWLRFTRRKMYAVALAICVLSVVRALMAG